MPHFFVLTTLLPKASGLSFPESTKPSSFKFPLSCISNKAERSNDSVVALGTCAVTIIVLSIIRTLGTTIVPGAIVITSPSLAFSSAVISSAASALTPTSWCPASDRWRFDPATGGPWSAPWQSWEICHADGDVIAHVEEVPQEVRRTYRYWIPCFACNAAPNPQGMTRLSDLGDGCVIYADRQGASFMLRNEP